MAVMGIETEPRAVGTTFLGRPSVRIVLPFKSAVGDGASVWLTVAQARAFQAQLRCAIETASALPGDEQLDLPLETPDPAPYRK